MKPSTAEQSRVMQCKEKQSRGKQNKALPEKARQRVETGYVAVAPGRPGGRFLIAVLALTDPSPPPSPPPFEPEAPGCLGLPLILTSGALTWTLVARQHAQLSGLYVPVLACGCVSVATQPSGDGKNDSSVAQSKYKAKES